MKRIQNVCLCVIAKNESLTLPRLLGSVLPLVYGAPRDYTVSLSPEQMERIERDMDEAWKRVRADLDTHFWRKP